MAWGALVKGCADEARCDVPNAACARRPLLALQYYLRRCGVRTVYYLIEGDPDQLPGGWTRVGGWAVVSRAEAGGGGFQEQVATAMQAAALLMLPPCLVRSASHTCFFLLD